MNLEDLDIDKDSIALDSYLTVLANILETLNQQIKSPEITTEAITKISTQVNESFSMYANIKNSILDSDLSRVETLEEEINTLLQTIQNKLDNDEFKGDQGDQGIQGEKGDQGIQGKKGDQGIQGKQGLSISKVETINNQLVITKDNGEKYNLGNFTNDYNNLTNKPFSFFRKDGTALVGGEYKDRYMKIIPNFIGQGFGTYYLIDHSNINYSFNQSVYILSIVKYNESKIDGFSIKRIFGNTSINFGWDSEGNLYVRRSGLWAGGIYIKAIDSYNLNLNVLDDTFLPDLISSFDVDDILVNHELNI